MPLTQAQLWKLRLEIVLNSLYYSDYENSLGLDRRIVAAFFELFKAIFMLVGWVIMIGCVLTKNNR